MKKNIFIVTIVALMVFFNSIFCYAEEPNVYYEPGWYKLEDLGWIYLKDDFSFAKSEWLWINKNNADNLYRHYYFNDFGFLVFNALTPDGKWVNKNGEEEVNGNVLIAHDGLGNIYSLDELKLIYPELNNYQVQSTPDAGITYNNNGGANVIYQNDMNTSNDIDLSKFKNSSNDMEKNKSYNSVYLEYRQRMVNRTISYARMIENELTSFDIYNGRADEVMKEYKDNITAIFDEGMEQIASLNQYKEYNELTIQQSNNAILFLQTTYNHCLTQLNDALIVVKSRH